MVRTITVSRDIRSGEIELCNEEGNEFIVNKQRVKPYQKDTLCLDGDDDVTLKNEGRGHIIFDEKKPEILKSFMKRDTAYQRPIFTRKRVFTIANTAYSPSAIRQLIIVTLKPVRVSQAENSRYPLEAYIA
nr:hypothetical protein [Tanacetum cinerariifolium]